MAVRRLGRKANLTDEQIEAIRFLRERQGLSPSEIRARTGIPEKSIDYWILRTAAVGSPERSRRGQRHRAYQRADGTWVHPFTPEDDAEILRMVAEGMPLTAMAREMDRAPCSISNRLMILRYIEIEARPPGRGG